MTRHLSTLVLLQLAAVLTAQDRISLATPEPHTLAEAWQAALAEAKAHKAPILAFVLPPADAPADATRAKELRDAEVKCGMLFARRGEEHPIATARDLLLRQVQWLRSAGARASIRQQQPPAGSPPQALLAMTVPVFAIPDACGAQPGETLVLLGADGKRAAGWALDVGDREAFAREVGKALLEPATLAARQASVPPALARDLQRRREIVAAAPEAASEALTAEMQAIDARLKKNLVSVAPLFVTGTAERREFASEAGFESIRPPLGCTAEVLQGDPCPACGMGFVPPELNTLLKLVGP